MASCTPLTAAALHHISTLVVERKGEGAIVMGNRERREPIERGIWSGDMVMWAEAQGR
jgi:hypothetical protein